MTSRKAAARSIARTLARGEISLTKVQRAFLDAVGNRRRWITPLSKEIVREFAGKRPSVQRLAAFIEVQPGFRHFEIASAEEEEYEPRMRPATGRPQSWNVPAILTAGELADRFNLGPNDLFWFADLRNLEKRASTKLCHYRRRWVAKSDGNFRLIEIPKQRLKQIQRRILSEILERIPAHEAAHGFVKGRSIVTFAEPHAGKEIVLKIDIRDFFPSFSFTRVHHLFLAAGYPDEVGKYLAGLCTTTCNRRALEELPVARRNWAREIYLRAHLPQGAPTSPALANLCSFNLDCRLVGLAQAANATYTRYADDLIFSGDAAFAKGVERFLIHAMAILIEEGFEAHARKTRVMRQGVAQKAAGLVLNARPNVARREYDRLKAILTNCVKNGAAAENRDGVPNFRAHLEGRVSHVAMVNPARGAKLKGLLEQIEIF